MCGIVDDAFLHLHADVIHIRMERGHTGNELAFAGAEFYMERLLRTGKLCLPLAFHVGRFLQKEDGGVIFDGFFDPWFTSETHGRLLSGIK